MAKLNEYEVTFPIAGGIFGVGRLATKLKALVDTDQIGAWHVGQWINFKHAEIRIRFGSVADGKLAIRTCNASD
jgi:hypothetical protein